MSAGETTVGSIVGFLRLDDTDFDATIDRAIAKTHELDGKNVDVKVKAETAGAETKLAAVAASQDSLEKSNKKLLDSSKKAGDKIGTLAFAAMTLGPALVPIAAATAGMAAGLSAMGAVGLLAFVGIRQEMAAGTAVGTAYTEQIGILKGDLQTLAGTAASGVLGPFEQMVSRLSTEMPMLNQIIGEFSGLTGRAASSLVSGLVAAFVSLEPLMRQVGTYLSQMAQRFDTMMSGPGIAAFGTYARSVFPQVATAIGEIVGALGHLLAALAPLGTGALSLLQTFAAAINAIPVRVLADAAAIAVPLVIGFKAFSMLSGPLEGVGTALKAVGISAEAAAVGVRALTIAAGAIGILLAVATFAFTAHANSVRADTQAVNDYSDALRQSNGAIDESIRQKAAQDLADKGALDTAKQLGISLSQLTDAALNQGSAYSQVTDALNGYIHANVQAAPINSDARDQMIKQQQQARSLKSALDDVHNSLQGGLQTYKDQTAATAASATSLDVMTSAEDRLANGLGASVPTLKAFMGAQQSTADAAAAATLKMQMENDAAGLLKASLDALAGKSMSVAQAQNTFDSSLANMGDHISATGKKIHFTTTSINDMSSASVALRGQLLGQVTAAETTAEAYGNLTGSTEKGREKLIALRTAIINNAVAHGVDRQAVVDYIDQVLQIPKTVPPTKLQVDTQQALQQIADLKAAIASISGGTRTVLGVGALANKQLPGHAVGGLITGPGSSTSDSIPAMLSSGEFVVNAAAVRTVGVAFLNAINGGGGTAASKAAAATAGLAMGGATGTGIAQGITASRKKILDAQKTVLDALQQQAATMSASVASSVAGKFGDTNLGGHGEITNVTVGPDGKLISTTTPAGMFSLLQNQQQKAKDLAQFSSDLGRLGKLGLNNANIQDIIGAGVGQGDQYAMSILGDPGQVRGLNAAQASIAKSSAAIGAFASQSQYGPQIVAKLDQTNRLLAQLAPDFASALNGAASSANLRGRTMTGR